MLLIRRYIIINFVVIVYEFVYGEVLGMYEQYIEYFDMIVNFDVIFYVYVFYIIRMLIKGCEKNFILFR